MAALTTVAFPGMRGTDDNITNARPEAWRLGISKIYPNGKMPLTGIMARMGSDPVSDPRFHWFEESLTTQTATLTGTYDDVGLATAYGDGTSGDGVAGTTVYGKMTAANALMFRVGHQVLYRSSTVPTYDVSAKVTQVVQNGVNSFVAFRLLEADDNDDTVIGNTLMVTGSINPEGGDVPDSIALDPTERENYTQIFRDSLDLTNTELATELRTGDPYKKAQRDALELHGIQMERAAIWGIPTKNTGANGKPERTTAGIRYYVNNNASANVGTYTTDGDFTGSAWTAGGDEFINKYLELAFRFGSRSKLGICGNSALMAISRLAGSGGQVNLLPGATKWGLRIVTWLTPFGELHLINHPLFSLNATDLKTLMVLDTQYLRFRPLKGRDTKFRKAPRDQGGYTSIDGVKDEYITEGGFEVKHAESMAIMYNLGDDA